MKGESPIAAFVLALLALLLGPAAKGPAGVGEGAIAPVVPPARAGRAVQPGLGVGLVGQIGGVTYAGAVQGGYAYIGVGPRLVVLNVADPAHPAMVGPTGVLPDVVEGVAVLGSYVYIADGLAGLRVVDISDPPNPSEVGFYETAGEAYGVAILWPHAYIAGGRAGLRVVDISDLAHPFEVGFYDTPGYAYGVAVLGSYAYVADADLHVVDISDPAHPSEVGFYDTPGEASGLRSWVPTPTSPIGMGGYSSCGSGPIASTCRWWCGGGSRAGLGRALFRPSLGHTRAMPLLRKRVGPSARW